MQSCQSVRPKFAEFFAGGGMVSAALRPQWDCVLANDLDEKKCAIYAENWENDHLVRGDIAELDPSILKQPIDMYWGSSPCQDFSLAGKGQGLRGSHSSVFYDWMKIISTAVNAGFAPSVIAFENVVGLLSRYKGRDLRAVISAFSKLGYRSGAIEIDARYFVPQSRPRLFVIAVRKDLQLDPILLLPNNSARSKRLSEFVEASPGKLKDDWIPWAFDQTQFSNQAKLDSIIETGCENWHSLAETNRLLSLMAPQQISKVRRLQKAGETVFGTIYKRGRPNSVGVTVQRAEARFDGIAGCLRTPKGGSSRQTLIKIEKNRIRTRLITTREAARLMGLSESFKLPERYNDAYHFLGDGVAVPVVEALNSELLLPIIRSMPIKAVA